MNADAIVIGLGNPGPRYSFTRHNAGFMALDFLAREWGGSFKESRKTAAEEALVERNGQRLLLLKPLTYMNRSGESLQALLGQFGHLRDKPLVVAHDEIDIPHGRLRVKMGGSDAGHNGLKSLRATLGHGDYYRLRLGVGKPVHGSPLPVADYVLQSFQDSEKDALADMLVRSCEIIPLLARGELAEAQRIAALPPPR
jgi:PTH1 family peptidyl-tRNA hydrolase